MKLKIDFADLTDDVEYKKGVISMAIVEFGLDVFSECGSVVVFSGNENRLRRLFYDIFEQAEIEEMAFYSLVVDE